MILYKFQNLKQQFLIFNYFQVDFMLGNFMEDLGITPKQFEDACNRQNTEKIPIPFDQVN